MARAGSILFACHFAIFHSVVFYKTLNSLLHTLYVLVVSCITILHDTILNILAFGYNILIQSIQSFVNENIQLVGLFGKFIMNIIR